MDSVRHYLVVAICDSLERGEMIYEEELSEKQRHGLSDVSDR